MKKVFQFFSIVICTFILIGFNAKSYAADGDQCTMLDLMTDKCNDQPGGLYESVDILEWISNLGGSNKNPCCIYRCTTNARHNGSNCVCNSNYYNAGTQCNACSLLDDGTWNKSTFPDTGGINSCYTDCVNQEIKINGVAVGDKTPTSATSNYPTPCAYETTCHANYFISGDTCEACPSSHPNSNTPDNANINKCYKNCGGSTTITGGSVTCPIGTAYYNNACAGCTVSCNAGYHVDGDTCTACPVDTYKSGPANDATLCTSCNTADGYTTRGATGQTSMAACKKTCPVADVTNGTWEPDSDIISQTSPATDCTYTNDANLTCNEGYIKTGSGASATCTGKTYTLKFNKNHAGASGTQPDITTCKFGEPCSWTNNFENPGYKQDGWATTAGGPTTINGTSYTQTGTYSATVTLYAKWTECGNDGKDHATGWMSRVCIITACENGYKVEGTNTNTKCSGRPYTIQFDRNGATNGTMLDKSATYNTPAQWNITYTRPAWKFDGWGLSSGVSPVVTSPPHTSYLPSPPPAGDDEITKLYAQWTECTNAGKEFATGWKARECIITGCQQGYTLSNSGTTNSSCGGNTYTVRFNGNGATAGLMVDKQCTVGVLCEWTSNDYGKAGSMFEGWTGSAGSSILISNPPDHLSYTPASPPGSGAVVNLYAKWTACDNTGALNADKWNPNCTILTCKVGYRWHNDGAVNSYGNTTACSPCAEENGRFCPGLNCNGTQCACEPGFYCPGYTTTKPATCVTPTAEPEYSGRCKCPRGATSPENSGDISECYIPGGTGGTRFCDSDGCFYLNRDITYHSS